ncbi:MAG: AAA family ATPase [Persephonella sp.]|nr:AAA family ATPase [Persephonella sp.]
MIIKRLRLQNFLSHKNTDIEFAENGITVFTGENGAGKSSIIEGIVFCLFGKTDRGNLSELISWGRNRATLELEFRKGRDLYKIERVIEIKGKKAFSSGVVYKYEKGRYIPYYQKNISKEIPKLTGISQKTFYSSVLVKQGDIEGLLNLPPRERAKVFEDILDMTLYQIISEAAGQKKRAIRSQVEVLKNSTGDTSQIKEELKKINHHVSEKSSQKKQLEERLKEFDRIHREKKSALETLIKERENNIKNLSKLEKAKELLKMATKQRDSLKKKITEIEKLEKKLPELESHVKKLKKLEEDLERIGEIELIKEKIKQISEKIEEYRKKEETVKNLENLAIQFTEAEKKLSELKEKLKKIEKIKGELETVIKQTDLIDRKSEEILKKLSQVLSELVNYRNSYFILKDNPLTIEQFLKNNEDKINQLQTKRDQIKEKKGSLKAYGEELKNRINNIQSIEGKCPTCSRPLDQHTKEEILKEIQDELTKRREEYRSLNKEEKEIDKSLDTELRKSRNY